jgi:ferritin
MPTMISKKMTKKLNDQVTNELFAAHAYLGMSCKFADMGLRVMAQWFQKHADEERAHGMKILHYIQEVGASVSLDGIDQPKGKYTSAQQIVKAALDHELVVTKQIHAIVALADTEKDYATRSFMQWFVDEQVEEVAEVSEILELVQRAGDKNMLQVEARIARTLRTAS